MVDSVCRLWRGARERSIRLVRYLKQHKAGIESVEARVARDREAATFDPAKAGWQVLKAAQFVELLGPVWWRSAGEETQLGLLVADKHSNRSGFAHGGVVTSLLDTALGWTARGEKKDRKQATINLNVQFVTPVRIGEFAIADCRVVKTTRSVVFMQGTLRV